MKYDLKNQFKVECARQYFEVLVNKGAIIELTEKKMPRSIDANRLYWVWLTCLQREIGQDKNELHFLYRATFLRKEDYEIVDILQPVLWSNLKNKIDDFIFINGLHVVQEIISRSTSELDEREFSQYLDEIKKHARVHFNVILLTLKDKGFEEFYREYGFIN